MDMITLAMAKAYADKKGGYTEPNVFTFDGNPDGRPVYSKYYVKISDKTPDSSTFVRARGFIGGQPLEVTAEDCMATKIDERECIYYGDNLIILVSHAENEVEEGTYVLCALDADSYVSYVEFAETIHPIDPKFLPGVCLPVVELETVLTDGTTFTDAESAALTKASEGMLPIVIVANFAGFNISLPVAYLGNSIERQYVGAYGTTGFQFGKDSEDKWSVIVAQMGST
jgi:hypothetical protein